MPYYDDMKEIRIYSPEERIAYSQVFEKKQEGEKKDKLPFILIVLFGLLITLVILLLFSLNKERKKRQNR
jgi:hypothetical protein